MKSVSLLFLVFIISFSAKAQNLVTNGSFEDYISCPTQSAYIQDASGWHKYTIYGTPDYFNSCANINNPSVGIPVNFAGYQMPVHGNGYSGLVDQYEFMHTSISPLTVGRPYEVSMYVSLADSSSLGSNGLGVYFYDNGTYPLAISSTPAVTPQISYASFGNIVDQTNWVHLVQKFWADSSYDNLVIGGYLSSPLRTTAPAASGTYSDVYYYIDSIVVQDASKLLLINIDTSLCTNTPFNLPLTLRDGGTYNSGNVFTVELSNASGSFASPTTIGTLTDISTNSIPCTIPPTVTGTGYRLRVRTSNPADTSLDNGLDIRITPSHTVTATTNAPICENNTLLLNATTVSGATYSWSGPGGFTDIVQNPSIPTTFSSINSGDYIVRTSVYGCHDTDTISVVVNPVPNITFSSNSPVCPGTTLQLNATTNLTNTTFDWTGPNSFNSTIANPARFPAIYADQGTYTLTATANSCSVTGNIYVAVYITTATPVASSNSPVCEGYPLNLSATCATPSVTYNWTGPAGYTSNQQNPTQPATMNHNGDFIVKATVNGCVSLPDTVNVQVYPKPYLGNYASPNDTVCEGTVVTFVTVPMNGVTNPSFQWFKNGLAVPGETNLRFVSSYATGDTFYCRTYCQNQCGDNLTLYSNKVGMTVLPVVTNLSVTLSSVPVQALPGNPVTFTATVAGGGYNPQYQWKKNGNDIWGANYAVYSADKLSPYDEIVCCVVSSDPCAVPDTACSDAMVINFPTSVADVSNGEGIMLYPNPNNGSFKVKIQKSKIKKIEVVNVAGQEVYQTQPETAQAEYSINLPSQLPAGTYMLKVNTADNIFRTTFTIIR